MHIRSFVAAPVLVALAALSGIALAQATEPARGTNTPLIDKQEANQQDRIKQGKQSGELTKHEARRLRAEQKAIDRKQQRAAADGTVTAEERQRLRKMQDKADKDIYKQKHDANQKPGS